jgi:hypothetical protein
MYDLIDRIAEDTTGKPETREDEIESVRAMIRKLERQIAAYYAEHPERIAPPTPMWKVVEMVEADMAEEAKAAKEADPVT